MTIKPINISFFEETKLGGRTNNQDYYAHLIEKNWSCFIIADGLGGHFRGEVASQELCEAFMKQVKVLTVAEQMRNLPIDTMEELVENSIKLMQKTIVDKYGSIDTHTTFALLWLDSQHIITAHVGDSRIYQISSNGVVWRTCDHTIVQELFDKGKIKEEDFESHPLQNKLLKTVNIFDITKPEIKVYPVLPSQDTIILCTDGFWTHLKPLDFVEIAKSDNFANTTQLTINRILKENPVEADNITVQVLRIV